MSEEQTCTTNDRTLIIVMTVLLSIGMIGVFTLAGIYDGVWLDTLFNWILPILGGGLTSVFAYVLGKRQKTKEIEKS
mgnify:CR=1 FL=1